MTYPWNEFYDRYDSGTNVLDGIWPVDLLRLYETYRTNPELCDSLMKQEYRIGVKS